MKANDLIKHLHNPDSKIRYKCILVVGMVEETDALGTLQKRVNIESETHIKKAVQWAIHRVETAKNNGQSTLNTIFDYFHINQELASGVPPEEAEMVRKMQQQLDSQLRDMQKKSDNQRGMMTIGAGLGGALIGNVSAGTSQASIPLSTPSGSSKSEKPALRIPPTQTSNADISQLIKRLINDSDEEKQRKSALALGDINNPTALPYLALTAYQHPDSGVKVAAEKSGKRIYWNFNYIAMEQDGRLEQEIAKRREEFDAGLRSKTQLKPKSVQAGTSEDISAILDRSQKKRKRRN